MSQKQVVTRPGGTLAYENYGAVAIGAAGGKAVSVVPAGKMRAMHGMIGDYVASATVGNRVIIAWVQTSAGVVKWVGTASANVTAGQTANYDIAFGVNNVAVSTSVRRNIGLTANTSVGVRENCPVCYLAAGDTIYVDDVANIDVADTINVRPVYTEYEA